MMMSYTNWISKLNATCVVCSTCRKHTKLPQSVPCVTGPLFPLITDFMSYFVCWKILFSSLQTLILLLAPKNSTHYIFSVCIAVNYQLHWVFCYVNCWWSLWVGVWPLNLVSTTLYSLFVYLLDETNIQSLQVNYDL